VFRQPGEFFVQPVDELSSACAQDLFAVGQRSGNPSVKDVVAPSKFCGADNGVFLAISGADEEDQTTARGDFLDDFSGASEVGSC
jgi:hypothetical protein